MTVSIGPGVSSLGVFMGATSLLDGLIGLIPAPLAGDEAKVLCGSGSWIDLPVAETLWGAITGTLSNQTDLQTALNLKQDSAALGSAAFEDIAFFAAALGPDDNYVTDAEKVVIGNTSGTNTGDQTLGGLGGVPTSREITINGVTQDLSANRTWTISASAGFEEVETDPASPDAGDVWVLAPKPTVGLAMGILGGISYTNANQGFYYDLSFRTEDGTTKRVRMS